MRLSKSVGNHVVPRQHEAGNSFRFHGGSVEHVGCEGRVKEMNGAVDDPIAVWKFIATNIALVAFGVLDSVGCSYGRQDVNRKYMLVAAVR
jgi:hypothetical protein